MKMHRLLLNVLIVLSASALPAEDRRSDKSRLVVMTLNAELDGRTLYWDVLWHRSVAEEGRDRCAGSR